MWQAEDIFSAAINVTVPNIGPYMPTWVETNLLLDDVSIQPFRCKPFSFCHSLVRHSFSVNRTTDWFLPSVPSDPEEKSLEATGSGTKSGWSFWYPTWLLLCYATPWCHAALSGISPSSIPGVLFILTQSLYTDGREMRDRNLHSYLTA